MPQIIAASVVYYPRSFLKFILLGFLLASLPLFYALGELILSLDQLQTQGREAVQQAAEAGRASRQLFEQSVTLERIVRQHLILEDNALLEDYGRLRQEFRATAGQLALLPLGPESQVALEALTDSESRLHKLLTAPQRTAEMQAQLADGYARLADRTQAMLAATNELTERAIEQLKDIAEQGRQKWLYLALATCLYAIGASIYGAQRSKGDFVASGEHAAYAMWGLVVIAVSVMMHALLTNDFRLKYVAEYSSTTLWS